MNCGRSHHPRSLVIDRPLLFTGLRIESVKIRIATTKEDNAIRDGCRRLNSNLVMSVRVFSGFETPFLLSGSSIEGVKITVPAANKHGSIHDRRGSVHDVASSEFPLQLSGSRLQCID